MIEDILNLSIESLKELFTHYSLSCPLDKNELEEDGDYYIPLKQWREQDKDECLACLVMGMENSVDKIDDFDNLSQLLISGAMGGIFNIIRYFFTQTEREIDRYLFPYDIKNGFIICKMYVKNDTEKMQQINLKG